MRVEMWTRSVCPDYQYEHLIQETGWKDIKDIALDGTPLGTGVGVEEIGTGNGFLAFDSKDGTYIIYYWRIA